MIHFPEIVLKKVYTCQSTDWAREGKYFNKDVSHYAENLKPDQKMTINCNITIVEREDEEVHDSTASQVH